MRNIKRSPDVPISGPNNNKNLCCVKPQYTSEKSNDVEIYARVNLHLLEIIIALIPKKRTASNGTKVPLN